MGDEESQVTLEAVHHETADQDPRDDWLGGTPELEWFPDGEPSREAPRRRGVAAVRARGAKQDYVLDPALRQRRLVAATAVVALVIAVVVIALVASGGGGAKPVTPPPTTPVTTTAATTTPAGTRTTPATHHSTSAALKLVLPASGKLALGDTGSAVKILQQALVKLGSGALTADGNFGSLTERAVAAFQQAHGLTGDGVVGAKTAAAINAALAAG